MTEYGFTLIVEGKLDLDVVEALFEAGCSDMTFQGDEAGPVRADVHREAANMVDAVLSAIRDIEHVAGLRVAEVDKDGLVYGDGDYVDKKLVYINNDSEIVKYVIYIVRELFKNMLCQR